MLSITLSYVNCTEYQVIVSGMDKAFPEMTSEQVEEITTVLVAYLKDAIFQKHDPACQVNAENHAEWLSINLGNFSGYVNYSELKDFNITGFQSLATLSPAQTAEMLLSGGTLNNTGQIDAVFDHLEIGNPFDNVKEFLTELVQSPALPDITPAVRDVMMNRTFSLISSQFPEFNRQDWVDWFTGKLTVLLPSFTADMLSITLSYVNCTEYQVIVSGMDKAFPEMTSEQVEEITTVLVAYLKDAIFQKHDPACQVNAENHAEWLSINLGNFSGYVNYSELKDFNITGFQSLATLSPAQTAEMLLSGGTLNNTGQIDAVFDHLEIGNPFDNVKEFLSELVQSPALPDITPAVRDVMMNRTFSLISSQFPEFNRQDWVDWFTGMLTVLLPSFTADMLSITLSYVNCTDYQVIVSGMDKAFPEMTSEQIEEITTVLVAYLKDAIFQKHDPACQENIYDDTEWLTINFGEFSKYINFSDLMDFNITQQDSILSQTQLAQLVATPGELQRPDDTLKIMAMINSSFLGPFFDIVSPVIQKNEGNYSQEIKSTLLQVVFERGNLSSPSVSDNEILLWLKYRLRPLLPNLNSSQVAPFFSIVRNRNCNINQAAIDILNQVHSSLNAATQEEIYNNIMLLLQDPSAMQCYTNGSFYLFLKKYFNDFGFPDLTDFLLLMPKTQQPKLINSILESELEILLQQPGFVGNTTDLCILLTNYENIRDFLEIVNVPDSLRQQILFCVWPLALSSQTQVDADAWFNNTLKDYLKFLTKDLISFPEIQTASCPSFWKLVSYLGESYTYSNSDFTQKDVYDTIKDYLNSGTKPKCYDSTDPQMNSTAWFVNNLNTFISFMSLDDLISFVPTDEMGLFLVNPEDIQLFSSQTLPEDVVSFCTSQIYTYSPNFDPLNLPGQFLCEVPQSVYMNQNQTQSISILNILNKFCNNSESAAALAENLQTININTIINLGEANSALTVSQLSSTSVNVLLSSLQTLSNVSGWSLDQTTAIIHTITAGGYKIDSAASLLSLGSLISGVPSTIYDSIPTSEIITTSQNQNFINNMIQAPEIVQDVYVSKIITISQDPNKIMQYVPDELASQIPLPLLVFSENNVQVTTINVKAWNQEQAIVFFGTVANATEDVEELAPSILQGFSCNGVSHLEVSKIIQLIQASRLRPGRTKVTLTETQLTCMNNYIQDVEPLNFTEYPSDMLLYYNYEKVAPNQCKSYFMATGTADFSIPSAVLNIDTTLLDEAKSCLGISGTILSADNVAVLGNMVCTLNGSYIENSDSLILEKLKNCNNFSMDQVTAIQNLLFTGATKYGNTSAWNLQTLYNLEPLPLYLTTVFWSMFTNSVKQRFLRSFLPQLMKNGVDIEKLRNLFEMLNSVRSKRGAACNGNSITTIQINDASFPFGFGLKDFNCMDVNLVIDNLATLATKVVATDLQNAILAKLNQAYPSGLPDGKVQLLGSISQVASLGDINTWNITTIDTLSALMKPSLGQWEPDKCKAIITKYLGTAGKSLGTLELNSIGGQNLCCLDVSVLQTINSSSLGYAKPLDISSCTTQQKNLLYQKAITFFNTYKSNAAFYQLIRPYLGGAGLQDIRSLSVMNINMDILTFQSLNKDVIMNLTVKEVQGLLGTTLPDLKSFKDVSILHQWIASQFQSDLNTLKIGLTGGRSGPVPTTAPAGNSANNPTKSTAASTTKHAATTGNGIMNPNNGGMHLVPTHWALTVLIGIIIISVQMLW